MDKDSEIERAIEQTIEDLPDPFLVIGKKTQPNPLEDYWMAKLEAIEEQYDNHIAYLERSLLDNRATRSRLNQKEEKIASLKKELQDTSSKFESLSAQNTSLKNKLSGERYKSKKLEEKTQTMQDAQSKLRTRLQNERYEKLMSQRKLVAMKHELERLERDRKFLLQEVSAKENERKRTEEKSVLVGQAKYDLLRSLTDTDQERRIQTEINIKLVEDLRTVLNECKSQEVKLLQQRKEFNYLQLNANQHWKEHQRALDNLNIKEKRIQSHHENEQEALEKIENLNRQVFHWKQEFMSQKRRNDASDIGVKDLRRENSHLRCQVAGLREKLKRSEHSLKTLQLEKQRTDKELEITKGQSESLRRTMCRNEIMQKKVATKFLEKHPSMQEHFPPLPKLSEKNSSIQQKRVILSYKKKVSALSNQKNKLQQQIVDTMNVVEKLKSKLGKYDQMEDKIAWTEKAMIKLESQRNEMQDLVKHMGSQVPVKMPFSKLVTDPSILDRMAKYEVLQKRLMMQTQKVETLKQSTFKIVEYRKRQKENILTDRRIQTIHKPDNSSKRSSEGTLADLDGQSLENGQTKPTVDRKFYNEYINYLEKQIPKLKLKIAQAEGPNSSDHSSCFSKHGSQEELIPLEFPPEDYNDEPLKTVRRASDDGSTADAKKVGRDASEESLGSTDEKAQKLSSAENLLKNLSWDEMSEEYEDEELEYLDDEETEKCQDELLGDDIPENEEGFEENGIVGAAEDNE